MYVPLHLEWLVLSTLFQFLLCTRVGDRLCGLINCSRLGKEEKHMVAVHDYRKPLVGHHSPIMYKQTKKEKPLSLHFWGLHFLGLHFCHCRCFSF